MPDSSYPIRYHDISKAHKTDAELQQKIDSHKDYTLDNFRGGNQQNSKICLPTAIQKKAVYWYHWILCNPVETRTEHTLSQHFDWKGLCTTVHNVCKKCPTRQIAKTTNQKYGKLPPKQAETNTWYTLHVDLIGPHTISQKVKICSNCGASQWSVLPQAGSRWHKYPIKWLHKLQILPRIIGLLVTHFHRQLCLIVVPNLCVNFPRCVKTTIASKGTQLQLGILSPMWSSKKMHQAIRNVVRKFDVSNIINNDPWSDILAATMSAVRATYHTTLQASPMQILFGRDAILNIKHVSDR